MPKDSSFDIVSRVDMQEIDNAVQQSQREVSQRYDLKDTGTTLTLDKQASTLTLAAPSEIVARQVADLLGSKLVRRKVDLGAVRWGGYEPAAGGTVRSVASIIDGIDQETARAINKAIKVEKFKVKVQIEGDKLRVSGPKKDALQDVIAFVKSKEYEVPLQFVNYR